MRRSAHIQYLGTAVIHKVPSDSAPGHCPPMPPFLVLHNDMVATKLYPGALVNFTGLQTTHQLPDLADGVEGRAKMHVLSTAESCTEGGLEPEGCALKWRGECENMLCDCFQSAEISGKGGPQERVVPSPGPSSTW